MKRHLLLIDDDSDEYDFYIGCHRRNSTIKIQLASDAHSGIELMHAELPDVVLLDMNMPAMNGLECLKKIMKTETLKTVPVYMYSNSDAENFVKEAKQIGAVGLL